MTPATSTTSEAIAPPARFMINFAGMLVNDIDEAKFADRLGTPPRLEPHRLGLAPAITASAAADSFTHPHACFFSEIN